MTGRIRTVKPEWLDDELLAAASDEARVLSIALLLLADDHGRGRASPATIATGAWRYEMERDDGARAPETLAKASRAFRELLAMRFVTVYEIAGQRYFEIRNWKRHQRVDRPSAPRVPPPNTSESKPSRDIREPIAEPSRSPREALATDPDLRSPISDPDHEGANEPVAWSVERFDRARAGDLGRLADHIQRRVGDAQVAHGGARPSLDTGSRWLRLAEWCVSTAAEPSRDMSLEEVIEQLAEGWAGDTWARAKGYPIGALLGDARGSAGNPQKYFAGTSGRARPSEFRRAEPVAARLVTDDGWKPAPIEEDANV